MYPHQIIKHVIKVILRAHFGNAKASIFFLLFPNAIYILEGQKSQYQAQNCSVFCFLFFIGNFSPWNFCDAFDVLFFGIAMTSTHLRNAFRRMIRSKRLLFSATLSYSTNTTQVSITHSARDTQSVGTKTKQSNGSSNGNQIVRGIRF